MYVCMCALVPAYLWVLEYEHTPEKWGLGRIWGLCVCMYVCMYVWYVCVCVCMCVSMYVCNTGLRAKDS